MRRDYHFLCFAFHFLCFDLAFWCPYIQPVYSGALFLIGIVNISVLLAYQGKKLSINESCRQMFIIIQKEQYFGTAVDATVLLSMPKK